MDYSSGMTRSARLEAARVLHQVMGRGIKKRRVFPNDEDQRVFVTPLASIAEDHSFKICA
jgi:hypothetical protein